MELENVNAKANAGLTTGVIGTALSGLQLLSGGVGNWLGGNAGGIANAAATMMCGQSAPISRYELDMSMVLAEKNARIQRLELSQETDKKVLELYEYISGRVRDVEDHIAKMNADQREWNATATGGIAAVGTQLAELRSAFRGITKIVVPNNAICPGWGDVTVTPAALTADTTPTA